MKDSKKMPKRFVSRNVGRLLVLAFLLCLPEVARSLEVPRLEGHVNDYAGLLSEREKAGLESLLRRFEAQTTNQVVLLVVPSLEGDSLEDFSIRVAEAWKPGQKGRDNGVIFLVAVEDRRARIEVGYGLEGALTDAQAGRIIRNLVAPAFREKDYYGGIQAGLVGILQSIQGEFPSQSGQMAPTRQARARASGLLLPLLFFLLLFSRTGRFFLLGGLLGGMFGGRGGMGRGGFGGGFGGFSGGGGGFGGGGASGSW